MKTESLKGEVKVLEASDLMTVAGGKNAGCRIRFCGTQEFPNPHCRIRFCGPPARQPLDD
jgi:hypothetical protein